MNSLLLDSNANITEELLRLIETAVQDGVSRLKSQIGGILQRLTDVEARLVADAASPGSGGALQALQNEIADAYSQFAEVAPHARRLGFEYAARAGANPIEDGPSNGGAKTLTRSTFSMLQPKDQAEFCRAGGRIVESPISASGGRLGIDTASLSANEAVRGVDAISQLVFPTGANPQAAGDQPI